MFCNKCGTQLPDGSAFCGNCGNRLAPVAPVAPVAPAAPVAVEAPAPAPAPAPVYQQPVAPAPAPAPKKQSNAVLIAVIAVVAVAAIVIGVLFGTGAFDKDDDKDDKGGSTTTTTVDGGFGTTTTTVDGGNYLPAITTTTTTTAASNIETQAPVVTQAPATQAPVVTQAPTTKPTTKPTSANVSYNKGTYSNGVYTNKWAELKYTPSGEWENGSAAEYAAFQNATTECGLCLKRINREQGIYDANLSIAFENVKGAVSAAEYTNILREALSKNYAASGYTYQMTDTLSTGLANYYWQEFTVSLNNNTLHQRMMIAEKDGYIICVTISAMDSAELNRIARNLTFYM